MPSKNIKHFSRSEQIQNAAKIKDSAYTMWNEGDTRSRARAAKQFEKSVGVYHSIYRGEKAHAFHRDYSDLQSNVSGRPGLTRRDYEHFRPFERTPTKKIDIQDRADIVYQKVSIIRNVIDLMSDFACQGVRIAHPNTRNEKFLNNWFHKVRGKDRSERFLNLLYRFGAVVTRVQTAEISVDLRDRLFRGRAKPDINNPELMPDNIEEIPWIYTFLDPRTIDVIGGPLASFVGSPVYAILIPDHIRKMIQAPKSAAEKALIAQLPTEIIAAAQSKKPFLLPADKTRVYHYKKDDWQSWANPMTYAIMDDVSLLEKLKLADMAALDGAISNIRIFKLGDLDNKIAPNPAAISKLAEILESNVGAGTMDLIWGPDITLEESKTEVHRFLGEEKYKPTLNNIYAGLGIPPTLTGNFGAAGTTNNFISLKTLTQRLEYGRGILTEFWEHELALMQRAMNFRLPGHIEYDRINLADEDAEKALLIQLADRDLISTELIQRRFGHNPNMERIRMNREAQEREKGKRVPKAGAFHDPQFGIALKKVALQGGATTPGQMGLREDAAQTHLKTFPKVGDEVPALKMRQPPGGPGKTPTKKKGPSGQGRPKNSKDSQKRKTKQFKPVANAATAIWANSAQSIIADIMNPNILQYYNKKNFRSLSSEEMSMSEEVKFGILCHLEPLQDITQDVVLNALEFDYIPHEMYEAYQAWSTDIQKEIDRKLTLDELRYIQTCIYTAYKGDNDG